MQFFKLFLPLSILVLTLIACNKDDDSGSDCGPETIETTIVGTWTETPIFGIGDEVTFNGDMSGSCTEESLFSTELNGNVANTFTWAIQADTLLELDYPNGIGVTYTVKSVACNDLTLDWGGFTVKLKRKG
ncbi:MAG: hypothetical protein CMN32_15690 [Saprospirales bacterium]|nr:hypothetical protein [Saprospirales bacterium]